MLIVGKQVLFHEPYRPPQVRWGSIGVIVDVKERSSSEGKPDVLSSRHSLVHETG
jgi:hypothetical protein